MRPRSLTFRTRLTLAFGGITFAACAAIIGLLYLFMKFVPRYMITSAVKDRDSIAPAIPLVSPTVPDSVTDDNSTVLEITDVTDILDTLLGAGLMIALLVAGIAGAVAWLMAGRALKPLQDIDRAARRAGEGALDHRIGITGPKDEITGLADTFDHTLDRLERAFRANERFAANAAHELRTPLAATKLILDTAHAHPTAFTHDELVDELTDNNTRSIDLVEALLTLTGLESRTEQAQTVDLDELAAEAVSGTALPWQSALHPAPALAPRTLATLAIGNLVTNAVVHNDEREYLLVESGMGAIGSWVQVTNTGAVIGAAEVAKLTEPLYRGSRTAGGGHGLGLAMVQVIAERYDGSLALTPRAEGGLVARLCFPSGKHNAE